MNPLKPTLTVLKWSGSCYVVSSPLAPRCCIVDASLKWDGTLNHVDCEDIPNDIV